MSPASSPCSIANSAGIFGLYSYREVFRVQGVLGHWLGPRFALGAMHALWPRVKTARELAVAGVTAGCDFDKNSAGPVDVFTDQTERLPMSIIEIKVPDIGDFDEVAVIELLVKPGDTIKAEQSLITVESDKASMEIPSSHAGVVKELKVKLGDKVKQGSVVLVLEAAAGQVAAAAGSSPANAAKLQINSA
jgi:biotin carboxyl carrier protein